MNSPAHRAPLSSPRVEYRAQGPEGSLGQDVLFAVEFGLDDTPVPPRRARVRLNPLKGKGLIEVWHATGPTSAGFDGAIRYTRDPDYLAGAIELDEQDFGGLEGAADFAYRAITSFQSRSRYPHVLRMWNYLDAINEGGGDAERYRVFCTGRKTGLGPEGAKHYPAATAIGRRDGTRRLQIYWLAGRVPGRALENPRQISAFQYPRRYGPSAPTFSRAVQLPPGLLLISGTASIVGHATQHVGDVQRQLDEIFSNLEALLQRAHEHDGSLPAQFSRATLLKAYVRHASDATLVDRALAARLPAGTPYLILEGDVCRSDLLVELDCQHAAG
jgi:chorismate lyase / 3-hydroxybenzoate synthase